MKQITRNWLLILTVLEASFLVGCAATMGKIEGNVYLSPSDNFSCTIPRLPGLKIRDDYGRDGGSVSFYGDEDNLNSIIYWRLQPEYLEVINNPITMRSFYREFFRNYVMPKLFLTLSPKIRILYENFVEIDQEVLFFSILEMAETQTFIQQSPEDRDYVIRGVFIFRESDFIYMLSDQYTMPSSLSREWSPPSVKQIDSRIAALETLYKRITFN